MANSLTSNTGAVVAPNVTFKTPRVQKQVFVYVDYDKGDGTSAALVISTLNPNVHASNTYQNTAFATGAVAPVTITLNANGRYRFTIPACFRETELVAAVTFADGTTQKCIVDAQVE